MALPFGYEPRHLSFAHSDLFFRWTGWKATRYAKYRLEMAKHVLHVACAIADEPDTCNSTNFSKLVAFPCARVPTSSLRVTTRFLVHFILCFFPRRGFKTEAVFPLQTFYKKAADIIMPFYFGCGTGRNKFLWLILGGFAVPMVVCWFTFVALVVDCSGMPHLQLSCLAPTIAHVSMSVCMQAHKGAPPQLQCYLSS